MQKWDLISILMHCYWEAICVHVCPAEEFAHKYFIILKPIM